MKKANRFIIDIVSVYVERKYLSLITKTGISNCMTGNRWIKRWAFRATEHFNYNNLTSTDEEYLLFRFECMNDFINKYSSYDTQKESVLIHDVYKRVSALRQVTAREPY